MLRTLALSAAFFACIATATPAATTYTVDTAHSTLGFSARQTGAAVDGRFKDFRAEIIFADEDLAHSRFDVTVQTKSVDTGEDDRDDTLRSPDLFSVDKFPTARFVTSGFTRKSPGHYEATGKLTLRDVTRDIRLPFTFTRGGNETWLKGGLTLNRLDYGIGQGEWKDTATVANEVKVNFSLRLNPARKP